MPVQSGNHLKLHDDQHLHDDPQAFSVLGPILLILLFVLIPYLFYLASGARF